MTFILKHKNELRYYYPRDRDPLYPEYQHCSSNACDGYMILGGWFDKKKKKLAAILKPLYCLIQSL